MSVYDFKLWTDETQANWRTFEKRVVTFLLTEGAKTGLLSKQRRADLEVRLAAMTGDFHPRELRVPFVFRREDDKSVWHGLDLTLTVKLDDNHRKTAELRKQGVDVADRYFYELEVDLSYSSGGCADCTEYRRFGEALAAVAGLGEQVRSMYLESGLRDGIDMYDQERIDESNRLWHIKHEWRSCLESDLRERLEAEFTASEGDPIEFKFTAKERKHLKEQKCVVWEKKKATNKAIRVEHHRGKPSEVVLTKAGKLYFDTFVWDQEEAEAA